MQSAQLITRVTEIAGACWSLAGELVRTHADKSPEAFERRTKQWSAIIGAVKTLDEELSAETRAREAAPAAAGRN